MTPYARSAPAILKLCFAGLFVSTSLAIGSGLWITWETHSTRGGEWFATLLQMSLMLSLYFLILLISARGLMVGADGTKMKDQ